MNDEIIIKGARLHNLKNLTLSIPRNIFVVITGLSGSGKSTLAFDTIHKEGQRQYLESLGMVTDYLSKPKVDSIKGLSPSISIDQHLTNRSPRSTVGTVTEVFTYLRVLYAKIGHRLCSKCKTIILPLYELNNNSIEEEPDDGDIHESHDFNYTQSCPECGTKFPEMTMAHFSFNKPEGACPACTGIGTVQEVNLSKIINSKLNIREGAVLEWDDFFIKRYIEAFKGASHHYDFEFDTDLPVEKYNDIQRDLLLFGVNSVRFKKHFPDKKPPKATKEGLFEGVVTNLLRRYGERIHDADYREKMEKLLIKQVCPECNGMRLKTESREVTVADKTIIDLSRMPLDELLAWIEELPALLSDTEKTISESVINDLTERLKRLVDVGVGYLSMERSAPTLSAGEAQRIRLASLLGSGLTGVLYVLDEPTIGLHPKDNNKLIDSLHKLRDLGNTILVIEHDLEIIKAADIVVDMGPGAGEEGGNIVAFGTPSEIMKNNASITGQYISGIRTLQMPEFKREGNNKKLVIKGAFENNLKNINACFPLGMLVAVTGVSGSGKSSLVFDILDSAARQHFFGAGTKPGKHNTIEGLEHINKIITIDQSAIGRTPRSNAATYTDVFTYIRKAFAETRDAKEKRIPASHFSFNVAGGRCERCMGAGVLTVEMHFLPDVIVRCPECHGNRFKKQIIEIEYNNCNISQVLEMTIESALNVFTDVPAVYTRLALMKKVGIGYLRLGQPATTLSGGEAQRVKLAKELGRRSAGHTLYLLDEPTTGLHIADVSMLLEVLHELVDAGNTVIVIEHNIDIIRSSDWIIDLGPDGGKKGGYIVAEGRPDDIAKIKESYTGQALSL